MNKNAKELEIGPHDLLKSLKQGKKIILVDVRGPDSFNEWHIFDSINYPLLKLIKSKGKDIERFKNQEIVTICARGVDSLTAAKELHDRGFNVKSLSGGLLKWSKIFDLIEIPVKESELKFLQLRRVSKGCLSYIVHNSEEAYVFDPASNIAPYLVYLSANELNVTKVFDTHLHADHISGALALAIETGADLYHSDKDPYNRRSMEFKSINDNQEYSLGSNKITSIWTPGHTKGSFSFKIGSSFVLSGDTVFINSIGRPDLANQVELFAKDLYQTLNKYKKFSNDTIIAPAHHGHIEVDLLHKELVSDIKTFKQSEILSKDEEQFIDFAKTAVKRLPHPPSYNQIRNINAGNKFVTPQLITELEIGPNRCAIN